MGCRAERQHRRLLQPVRGGPATKGQARCLRLLEPCRWLLPAQAQDRRGRAGTPGLALRGKQGVRRGDRRALCLKHGLRVTCIRIGNFGDAPVDHRRLAIWVSPQDLVALVRIGLEHPDIRFEIFFGVSDNERGWWDNGAAFRYGYRPTGRAEDHVAAALAAQKAPPPDRVADWYQGGPFCSAEFDGDTELAAT